MKKNEIKILRTKKTEELLKEVSVKKAELTKFTAKMFAGGEKNLKKGRNLKKEIAQILTVVREKAIIEKEAIK